MTHPAAVDERLQAHLRSWLGAWPPERPVHVVGSSTRIEPGWDGVVRPVNGVATPFTGRTAPSHPGSVRLVDPTTWTGRVGGHAPSHERRCSWRRSSTSAGCVTRPGYWRAGTRMSQREVRFTSSQTGPHHLTYG